MWGEKTLGMLSRCDDRTKKLGSLDGKEKGSASQNTTWRRLGFLRHFILLEGQSVRADTPEQHTQCFDERC